MGQPSCSSPRHSVLLRQRRLKASDTFALFEGRVRAAVLRKTECAVVEAGAIKGAVTAAPPKHWKTSTQA